MFTAPAQTKTRLPTIDLSCAARGMIAEEDAVGALAVVVERGDLPYLGERGDVRAVLLGEREVVEVERVLRVVVAPDVALAAVIAPGLRDTELVRADLARVVELDGDVRVAELVAATELVRDELHQLRLRRELARRIRDRPDAEHRADQIVVGVEPGAVVAVGPPLREDVGDRPQVHVRVDERASPHPAAWTTCICSIGFTSKSPCPIDHVQPADRSSNFRGNEPIG